MSSPVRFSTLGMCALPVVIDMLYRRTLWIIIKILVKGKYNSSVMISCI